MVAVPGWRRGPNWLAVLTGVAALAVAGCGSDNKSSSDTGSASAPAAADTTAAPAPAAADTTGPDPQPAVAPRSGGSGTPIKIAIMSECQGAFGSFDNQNMAGAVAALSQFAGAKPKNPNKPKDGFTGGAIGDHPLKLVGVGCGNDQADTAIKETRRLMEQLGADIMIGPLSGDESIAVANYAKQHPDKTFVDGSAGAQDTTLKVKAPNFYRFNGDGAQWNAGLGDLAFNKLGWKKAAIISDDYSFGWTSTAGFIADFCAAGGQITKRVFPPLNTTDYSSFAQQLPDDVDGTFVAVGGAGLIPFLKAYEQAKGPIDSKKFIGNLFWGTPGQFEQLGPRVSGAYIGGAGTAGDLNTPAAQDFATNIIGKWFKKIPPGGDAAPQSSSTFTYGYYVNTWGLIKGLEAVKGDISGGQKKLQAAMAKVTLPAPYGEIKLDDNRQAVTDVFYQQLYTKDGKLAVKTIAKIPSVDQTFGGTFSASTPAPGRNFPTCEKKSLPWIGKSQPVKVVG
ncbi:MAG: branched-chain amino acid transport system substrate-binding protein [Solirubrobacteraceae bacterium]|nr:branched-chain amino acid transport system substrate-binding protein [Solirubrobacteraceae bacterium]